jgi:hypothetical protein
MGAKDPGRCNAEVAGATEFTRPFRFTRDVQEGRPRSNQARKVHLLSPSTDVILTTILQGTRHQTPHRQTPPRPQNARSSLRPPLSHKRSSRPPPPPPPHPRIRHPRLRPPTSHLLNPQPSPLRRLCRARGLLHGAVCPGTHTPSPHHRALDRSPRQFHLQKESGEL